MAKTDRAARRGVRSIAECAARSASAQDRLVAVGALERAWAAEAEAQAAIRDEAIRARRAEGGTWADVAREVGISVTRMQQIRSARRLDEPTDGAADQH
jgi:hypothetical protein